MHATFTLNSGQTLDINGDTPRPAHDPGSISLTVTDTPVVSGVPVDTGQSRSMPPDPDPLVAKLALLAKMQRDGFDPASPDLLYYGPHPCADCGDIIVKTSHDDGGLAFDAPPDLLGHPAIVYPNTRWLPHIHGKGTKHDPSPRVIWSANLRPSHARAVASALLSAATEARER
jgi:hypothetical protein